LSTTAQQTRHTVTAIIVAHDGARLLPGLVKALRAQTYPAERIVGVDTGSRDRSGAILAELIGQDAVFGMDRGTGYGEAVAVAVRHSAAKRAAETAPGVKRVDWIWLLHDDCEPEPETLERLLRAASRDRSVVVLGPKVLDGQDRRVLREVGVAMDRAGRRITGIEPGEIDQGQHDYNRAVLAVGSAGMLIRRDAWDRLGGFDTRLKLFRDDLDFCWRAQGAGYRVQVVTDAVLYHRELSARRRRGAEGGSSTSAKTGRHPLPAGGNKSARMLDRRNALYVLAVNLPLLTMLRVVTGCIVGSLVRAAYFLLTKQLDLAAAQIYGVTGLIGHPLWLWRGRRRRAAWRAEGYAAVRTLIPHGRTLSRLAEGVAGLTSSGPPHASGGMHQAASEEPEDAQFVDAQSIVRRVIANSGVQLFAALTLVALIAERRLLGTSPLGGGALVPAWGGAPALWREYLAGFHPASVGSTALAPPYLAVVAALATVLGGQAWLAVDVLLLGCVPLAGLTAYLATRRLVAATAARLLLAASYALLPVATGAVAAGRLGTAVAYAILPLIALSAARVLIAPPRQARRAAWATGLLVAVAAAFAPLVWVFGAVFAIIVVAARRWLWPVSLVNAAIVVVTPVLVLFPWSLHLLASPSAFLTEAGIQPAGLTTSGLGPAALMLLSPGGPGLPPIWVTVGIGLAVIGALLPNGRTELTVVGWCVAVAGFLGAVVMSRVSVTPEGGQAARGWPGVALAVAALGLLIAAAPVAQWLAGILSGGSAAGDGSGTGDRPGGVRRLLAGAALAAAATAPVLVAFYWVTGGVRGPVGSVTTPVLPAFVSVSANSGTQYRTLILRPAGAALDYAVIRQSDPTLGEPELTGSTSAEQALSRQVAALGAPDSADNGDPGLVLGQFGIRWVLLPGPVNQALATRLNAAVGLVPRSSAPAYDLWEVAGPVARVRVIAPDGTVTPLPSQSVGMRGVSAPASGGTLVLAEPYGEWTATLNGTALKPLATPVDGWAQGFVLPAGGGRLVLTRNDMVRAASLIVELIALLAVCVLALPGKRADPTEEAEALAAVRAAQHGRRAARGAQVPERSGRAGRRALDAARTGRAGRAAAAGLSVVRRRAGAPENPGALPDGGEFDRNEQPDEASQWDEADQWEQDAQWVEASDEDQTDHWDEADQWDQPSIHGDRNQRQQTESRHHDDAWTGNDAWTADDPWRGTGPRSGGGKRDEPARLTGPQSAARGTGPRETAARGTGPHETAARGTGPREIAPREIAPWESDARRGEPRPSGPHPVIPRGTGPTPSWRTGPQEAAPWAADTRQPVSPTGPQPAALAPWETGEPDGPDGPDGPDEPAVEDVPARRTERAERHSHRASKHGRPGRRRGPADRSGRDGGS